MRYQRGEPRCTLTTTITTIAIPLLTRRERCRRSIAPATYRKMVQNLWWATGYNAVAIPLAAGVLARAGILLSPALGAVLMSVSTVVVALNAQLLGRGYRSLTGVA